MDKFEHGEKVTEAQKRIAVPRTRLLRYRQVDGRLCDEYAVLIAG
jgi:hypothetical protein